mgnify:CR=1 FL=1
MVLASERTLHQLLPLMPLLDSRPPMALYCGEVELEGLLLPPPPPAAVASAVAADALDATAVAGYRGGGGGGTMLLAPPPPLQPPGYAVSHYVMSAAAAADVSAHSSKASIYVSMRVERGRVSLIIWGLVSYWSWRWALGAAVLATVR